MVMAKDMAMETALTDSNGIEMVIVMIVATAM